MPSTSKTRKAEYPLQLVTDNPKANAIVITVNAENQNVPLYSGKEEAGKPLYLKRV